MIKYFITIEFIFSEPNVERQNVSATSHCLHQWSFDHYGHVTQVGGGYDTSWKRISRSCGLSIQGWLVLLDCNSLLHFSLKVMLKHLVFQHLVQLNPEPSYIHAWIPGAWMIKHNYSPLVLSSMGNLVVGHICPSLCV